MDTKHLRAGTTLYLPIGVVGALFSVGDTHSTQGDGEVCGTAIETAMDVSLASRSGATSASTPPSIAYRPARYPGPRAPATTCRRAWRPT
jgi:acetamidase/formamidase